MSDEQMAMAILAIVAFYFVAAVTIVIAAGKTKHRSN